MSEFIIGLTGGVASGKSEVGRHFEALGIVVADADQAARDAVAIGSEGLADVIDMFGAEQQLCRVTGNAPHAAVAYRLPRPVCHAQQLPAKCAVSCADSDSQSISLRCST